MVLRHALPALLLLTSACAHVEQQPLVMLPEGDALARASMNGKYADLLGTLDAPEDEVEYGSWRDYGWWRGRTYKGVTDLPDGYWVYVAPTWYIWQTELPVQIAPPVDDPVPANEGYVPAPELQTAPAECLADENHCCMPDGVLQIPGGCQPSYPTGVFPGVERGDGGWCQPVECNLRCLPPTARLATPRGAVPVSRLRVGDEVWTLDRAGRQVAAPLRRVSSVPAPAVGHLLLELTLSDGRVVRASAGHPTAASQSLAKLRVGSAFDGATVTRVRPVRLDGAATWDVLPDGDTGAYWADGVLLGSTLR